MWMEVKYIMINIVLSKSKYIINLVRCSLKVTKRLKNEVESINKKIIELGSDSTEETLIEEKKIR